MNLTRWMLPEPLNSTASEDIAGVLGVDSFTASILAARGYTADTAAEFLENDSLPDPYSLVDMDKAVETIEKVISEDGLILVYGDYDADGVTATAILYTYLRERGANVNFYIPKRFGEGYGLNRGVLTKLYESYHPALIVTVDNGVTAHEEIAFCNSIGLPVVVTDHHQPTETLPEALAVVDPHRSDNPVTGRCLCGAGLALMLVCALERDYDIAWQYADLATLGTIGDVVPLLGENRVIVRMGLEKMLEHSQTGIEELRKVAHLTEKDSLTAEQIAFGLVPRINAAGRMGSATIAVRLLISSDPERCAEYAATVQECNEQRKQTEAEILQIIDAKLASDPALLRNRILFLSGEGWHAGVVGIVASRLVERYGKPCVLVSVENGVARASARSVEGFSIFDAFCAAREYFSRFGGHAMAGGFTTEASLLEKVSECLERYAAEHYPEMPAPVRRVDLEVLPSQLTLEAIQALDVLEPCGTENEKPLYLVRNARLDAVYPMGQGKHVRLKMTGHGGTLYCVWFGMTPEELPFPVGSSVDFICSAFENEYNGELRLSVRISEMRPSGFDFDTYWTERQLYEKMLRRESLLREEYLRLTPDRSQVTPVYLALRELRETSMDPETLQFRIPSVSYGRLRVVLEVLREFRLIEISDGRLTVPRNPQKVNLENSRILRRLASLAESVEH